MQQSNLQDAKTKITLTYEKLKKEYAADITSAGKSSLAIIRKNGLHPPIANFSKNPAAMSASIRRCAKIATANYPLARKLISDKREECRKLSRKLTYQLFFYSAAYIDEYSSNRMYKHAYEYVAELNEEEQCMLRAMLHVIIINGQLPDKDEDFPNAYFNLTVQSDADALIDSSSGGPKDYRRMN